MRKRVLFVDLGTSYGGVETYLEGLAEVLGADAELFALSSIRKLTDNLKERGACVFDISWMRSKWMKPVRCLSAMFLVPWLIATKQIDVVQINGFFESYLLPLLRLFKARTVYTMHGPLEIDLYVWYRNPERYFPRLLSSHALQFATCVVCVSHAVGDVARTILPENKIVVIPNWVKVRELPLRTHRPAEPIHLLWAGRVEQYKGIQFILDALRRVPGLQLSVAGTGTYLEQIRKQAEGLPVNLCGFVNDLSPLYSTADIFINPSLGPEGLPLVSLEAMSYGLACIFSDLPVHREISDNGKAALLFTAGDSESLISVLEKLSGDANAIRAYGQSARRRVEEEYSFQAIQDRYRHLLLQ